MNYHIEHHEEDELSWTLVTYIPGPKPHYRVLARTQLEADAKLLLAAREILLSETQNT